MHIPNYGHINLFSLIIAIYKLLLQNELCVGSPVSVLECECVKSRTSQCVHALSRATALKNDHAFVKHKKCVSAQPRTKSVLVHYLIQKG